MTKQDLQNFVSLLPDGDYTWEDLLDLFSQFHQSQEQEGNLDPRLVRVARFTADRVKLLIESDRIPEARQLVESLPDRAFEVDSLKYLKRVLTPPVARPGPVSEEDYSSNIR